MNRPSGPRKTPSSLSDSLHQQLNLYALAASAAGVSVLALVQPAEAKVVYTAANIAISHSGNFSLDLNNDGIRDFLFERRSYKTFGLNIRPTKLRPENSIWGTRCQSGCSFEASALSSGVTVGPSPKFQAARHFMFGAHCGFSCTSHGPWKGAQNKYLGLAFHLQGKVHYGWARVSIVPALIVTGYAYETVPNKSILTGQTQGTDEGGTEALTPRALNIPGPQVASLGLLARGSSGLAAWRRRED